MTWVTVAQWLQLGWLLVQWGAMGTAHRRRRRREMGRASFESPAAHESQSPSVLVVRPCAGDEPFLEQALHSTEKLSYEGRLCCVFAVGRETDPAWHVASRVAGQLRAQGVDARVVVTRAEGPNHKADQLARVIQMHESREELHVVLCVDSDVELTPLALQPAVTVLLGDRSLGALWAPFAEVAPPRTAGDFISQAVLNDSMHATAVLAGIDPSGMTGKFVALHAARLREVGGFEALTAVLGEDMELAARFRLHGYRVEACGWVARSLASGRSVRDVAGRLSRWVWVIRAQRPALLLGYPFMLAAFPLQMACAVMTAQMDVQAGAVLLIATLLTRMGLAVAAHQLSGRPPTQSWLRWAAAMLAADFVLLAAWVRALLSRTVEWRGRPLLVRGGVLHDAPHHASRKQPS